MSLSIKSPDLLCNRPGIPFQLLRLRPQTRMHAPFARQNQCESGKQEASGECAPLLTLVTTPP